VSPLTKDIVERKKEDEEEEEEEDAEGAATITKPGAKKVSIHHRNIRMMY